MKVFYYTNRSIIEQVEIPVELQHGNADITLVSHRRIGQFNNISNYLIIDDYRKVKYREALMLVISSYFENSSIKSSSINNIKYSDFQEALRYRLFFASERYFFLLYLYKEYIESGKYDRLCLNLEHYDDKLVLYIFNNYNIFFIKSKQLRRVNIWIKIIHFCISQTLEWTTHKKLFTDDLPKGNFVTFFEFVPRNIKLVEKIAQRLRDQHIETIIVTEGIEAARSENITDSNKIWLGDLLSYKQSICILFSTVFVLWKTYWSNSNVNKIYNDFFSKIIITLNYKDSYQIIRSFIALRNITRNPQFKIASSTSIVQPYIRAALISAKLAQKPTFLLQHGLTTSINYECYIIQNNMLAWGKFNQKQLSKNSINQIKVNITGYTKGIPPIKNTTILPVKKRITYFPTTIEGSCMSISNSISILELLGEAIMKLPNYEFYIRPKPGTPLVFYTGYEQFIDNSISTEDQILHSQIILATTSTVGVEACFYDKDVILLCVPEIESAYYHYYEDYGAAIIIKNSTELIDAIHDIEQNVQTREYLRIGRKKLLDEMFTPDIGDPIGMASRIILNTIHEN